MGKRPSTASSFLGMPLARFLREHWQKKPLLVRGAFAGLVDPLAPDELAGLACEDGVESRIVREQGGARPWEVTWGPQSEDVFATLPERGWTILVQELNRWVPDAALLLERFAFLPSVRVDDVMVSYAAPGGSVGAHLDSYDVFLVQGMGERRWQYGTKPVTRPRDRRFVEGLELRILERFVPDADEVLGPGDMLYLPPGFAHHGTAVTPCFTYSVGFRSPGLGEMWRSFGAHRARHASGADRLLEDPPLAPAANPGAIPEALLARVREAIRGLDTSDEAIDRWFAAFATELSPGHELEAPSRRPTEATIFARLAKDAVVERSEEGRWAYLPRGSSLLLYIAGQERAIGKAEAPLARHLASARRFRGRELTALATSAAAQALIAELFAAGALRFAARSARASAR